MRTLPNLFAFRMADNEGANGAGAAAGTVEAPATTKLPEQPTLPKTLQDVQSTYYAPSDLSAGVNMIQHISSLTENGKPVSVIFNGDWPTTGEFPASHGLLLLPIGETVEEKGEKKRVTRHVVAAAVPTLEALLQNDAGKEYVERSAQSAFSAKIRNALIRAEDVASVKLPLTIEEFIERAERGAADQGLASYKAVATNLVKALGTKGVATNVALLRQILSSTAFAQALMPKVAQKVWVRVLEAAKAEAAKKNLPTTIFDHWQNTRDQAAIEVAMDDIDL